MRITPENITSLKEDEVFVFGSNLSGFHGAGAARQAMKFGAIMLKGTSFQGQTYAIPTKDSRINTLPVIRIKTHVNKFIRTAKVMKNKKFFVTAIGCGLAGYTAKDIAPLFRNVTTLKNVWLPESFWEILEPNTFKNEIL